MKQVTRTLLKVKLMSDSMHLVKQLREMTGAGILDCKKYLDRANNNLDDAIKLLRSEAGLKADKKVHVLLLKA